MIQKHSVPLDEKSVEKPKLFLSFESSSSKAVIAISDVIDDFGEDGFQEAFSIQSIKNKHFGLLWGNLHNVIFETFRKQLFCTSRGWTLL